MNIPDDILDMAEQLGLQTTGTGGNIDYVIKQFPDADPPCSSEMVLGDDEDAGSPDSLDAPCRVTVYAPCWSEGVSIHFPNSRIGLEFIAKATRADVF